MKSLKILFVAVIILGGVCTTLYAQELSVGKYSGRYTSGRLTIGLDLTIASIENGTVNGTVQRYQPNRAQGGGGCGGVYPVEGTYKEGNLVLKSGKGGSAGDCTANLRLVVEGNKLTGTMGTLPVELSK